MSAAGQRPATPPAQRCRVCGGTMTESQRTEQRDGTTVRLAYHRECKRIEDRAHNAEQNQKKRRRPILIGV